MTAALVGLKDRLDRLVTRNDNVDFREKLDRWARCSSLALLLVSLGAYPDALHRGVQGRVRRGCGHA